jgi:hypothetical protein
VLATADGRSYPPGHPARPPRDADPIACYDTAAQATAAGYPPAPLPAGVLEVGGVYLLPPTGQLHRQCRRAAQRLGVAVPCPMLLPAPAPNTAPPTLCERQLCDPKSGLLFELGGFVVPPGYVGVDPATGARLAIGAAKQTTAFPVACAGEQPAGGVTVRGRRGHLFACPPGSGPHRGSVLLRWRERGLVMAVSVNGHSDLNRRLVLALAAHLELVPLLRITGNSPDSIAESPRPLSTRVGRVGVHQQEWDSLDADGVQALSPKESRLHAHMGRSRGGACFAGAGVVDCGHRPPSRP